MFNKKNLLKIGSYAHKFGQGGPLSQNQVNNNNEPENEKEKETPKFDFDKFEAYNLGDTNVDCGGF